MSSNNLWRETTRAIIVLGVSVGAVVVAGPGSRVLAQEATKPVGITNIRGSSLESSGTYDISISGAVYNTLPYEIANVKVVALFPEKPSEPSVEMTIKKVDPGKTAEFLMQKQTPSPLTRFVTFVASYDIASQDVSGLVQIFSQSSDVVTRHAIVSQFGRLDVSSRAALIDCLRVDSRESSNEIYAPLDLLCLDALARLANKDAVLPLVALGQWYESPQNQAGMQATIDGALNDQGEPLSALAIFKDKKLRNLTAIDVEILKRVGDNAVPVLLEFAFSSSSNAGARVPQAMLAGLGKAQITDVLTESDPTILLEITKIYSRHRVSEAVLPMLSIDSTRVPEDVINSEILSMEGDAIPGLVAGLYDSKADIARRSERLLKGAGPSSGPALENEILKRSGKMAAQPGANSSELVAALVQLANTQLSQQVEAAFQRAWEDYQNGKCGEGALELDRNRQVRDNMTVHPVESSKIYACAAGELATQEDDRAARDYFALANSLDPTDRSTVDQLFALDVSLARKDLASGDTADGLMLSRESVQLHSEDTHANRLLFEIYALRSFVLLAGAIVSLIALVVAAGNHI